MPQDLAASEFVEGFGFHGLGVWIYVYRGRSLN